MNLFICFLSNKSCFADHEGLSYTNEERMQFVQKIINLMDVGDNIVFLGHSRGSENALRLAARNPVRS